ncbi:YbaB/EbfC family nucleoid-associated protein [Weissella muntiaci]|uniref:Nucleoid-associated protein ESZ50_06535 n=1 Tax=Weissella muntiaci TaxID=2508881 RepID=A0A6C2C5C7_9LACO|nr:YbaB/EbfC family nucleoid-associated protein [Weissella muntiaci]TYC48912.1 YbaB/EbfC family nucleoid-associated protein [Weissella muntiaci]
MFGNQNMQQMMKQVKQMQANVESEQAQIADTDYVGHAPADAVVATFTGDRILKDLQFAEGVVDADDPDTLADMMIAAVNDALKQIDADSSKRLGQYMPNMPF